MKIISKDKKIHRQAAVWCAQVSQWKVDQKDKVVFGTGGADERYQIQKL